MKNAKDFIVDSALGDKSYKIDSAGGDQIVLSIEEDAVPARVLKEVAAKAKQEKGRSLFARIDEAVQSMGKPKPKEKAAFFRLMSIMINAGVPLIRALDTVAEQTVNKKLKKALAEIARSIEKGATFSDSLGRYADLFDDAQVGIVRAAEASGQLNEILKQLALEVEKSAAIRRKVKGAMMYPAFILVIMLLVVAGMMIFIVPQISNLFKDGNRELPGITKVVIAISNFMIQRWPIVFGGILGLVLAAWFGGKTAPGRRTLDWITLHIPLFGGIVRQSLLARFSRTLGNLLRSGVPITQSLKINAQSLGNEIYRERIGLVAEDIARGIPLGESLRDSPDFPPMMVQMIAVGEQTAQLDNITGKIAEYYEEEVDAVVGSISKLIEPFLMVTLGLVVGGIVMAVMFPIFQLSSFAG